MPVYSAAFKARVVKRLVGPQAVSATQLADAVGVPQPTLSRWVRELRSVDVRPRRERKDRTGAEKLRIVQEAAGLDEAALGALLRREGLQLPDLIAWRQAAEQALDAKPARPKAGPSAEAKRVQELERELERKERALAEAAALLVPKINAHAIWGDADDITPPRSGRCCGPSSRTRSPGGARRAAACAVLGVSVRTLERWRAGADVDQRQGPRRRPANALAAEERATLLATVNSAAYCDLTPHQIVPRLADAGQYVASESTMYRVLRDAQQLAHRSRAAAPQRRAAPTQAATGPNQVWSWDITYLKSPVRGVFWYLYLMLDLWSRKIVGWTVEATKSSAHAATLVRTTCAAATTDPTGLVLHADNGGPMKGSKTLSTLKRLGVLASFSRPGVSNDHPFSEALFRTLKNRPDFPREPFADVASASRWVAAFVAWYNHEHRHSAIRFVTPAERHDGLDVAILAQRASVYADAKAKQPSRWSGATRDWSPITSWLSIRSRPRTEGSRSSRRYDNHLDTYCARDRKELEQTATQRLRSLQRQPAQVRKFFQHPRVQFAA